MSYLRDVALHQWLSTDCQLHDYRLVPITGDASFRRYFRVNLPDCHYVAMDAPPPLERCDGFVAISQALRALQLQAPEIFAADLKQGFLLLTDFGSRVLLNELNADNAEKFYELAITDVLTMQTCANIADWPLAPFTADFMLNELKLFQEWFLEKYLQLALTNTHKLMLDNFFKFLATTVARQPYAFMHRDYHSANLMILSPTQLGHVDFQDAFIGPITYDIVSLLRDCYIRWPQEFVKKLALQFKSKNPQLTQITDETFLRWFDLMALQRHLKALLTFSRKYCRDNDRNYLQHIPRTLQYVEAEAIYPECLAFHEFLHTIIMPSLAKVSLCAQ